MSAIMSRTSRAAAAVLALALLAAGCSSGSGTQSVQAVPAGAPAPGAAADAPVPVVEPRFGVGVEERTVVDASRPTDPFGDVEGTPERTIPVTVWYPSTRAPDGEPAATADPATADGPFPLLVFAHGLGGAPQTYQRLLTAVAARGHVVVGPSFPLTHRSVAVRRIADIPNQAGDVSFVIDEMLRFSSTAGDRLAGLVDADRVAIGGHSAGGMTTLLAGFHTCCADERVDAALVVAGAMAFGPAQGEYFAGDDPPVLFLHGDDDPIVPYGSGVNAFDAASPPKWMLTLVDGDHTRGFVSAEPWYPVVEAAVVDFLDATIGADASTPNRLESFGTQPGVTRLEAVAG